MYVLTMTTPKVDNTIVGATTCHKTAERMARELHIDLLKQAGVTDEEIEACDNLNDLHPEICVSIEHTQVTPPDPDPAYLHPIYQLIERLSPPAETATWVVESFELSDIEGVALDSIEEGYKTHRDQYFYDTLMKLNISDTPDEPSEDEIPSYEELRKWGLEHGVEFAPEDARHPLVCAIYNEAW